MRELYFVDWDKITTLDELKSIIKCQRYSIAVEGEITDPELIELIDKGIYIKA